MGGGGPLVADAAAFRLDVYGAQAACAGSTVTPGAGPPMESHAYNKGDTVSLSITPGLYTLVLTTYADVQATSPLGQGCIVASASPGARLCFDLTIAPLFDMSVNFAGADLATPADAGVPPDLARTPPMTPTGLTATAGDTQVSLNWNASTGAMQYTVARATSAAGPYQAVGTPTATSYLDTGLINGTTYYYEVSAIGTGGTSNPSAPASAKPTQPVANGTYRLINHLSGLALDDNGAGGLGTGLVQWGYSGATNQQWTLTAVGAYYTITCAVNGLNASANGATASGTQIVLANPASTSDQLWTIAPQAGGYYVLTNKLSGLVLDDYNNSTSAGTAIDQLLANAGISQQWSILPP